MSQLAIMSSCLLWLISVHSRFSSGRGGAKHVGNLLSDESTRTPWLYPGHALNRPRFSHQRPIETGGGSGDNSLVLSGKVALGQWHRSSPPDVIGYVAEESGDLAVGTAACRTEATVSRGTMGSTECGEAGEASR